MPGIDQRRVTLWIVGTGIVALLLVISLKPAWLSGLFNDPPTETQKPQVVSDALMGGDRLQPDEINVVPNEPSAASGNNDAMIDLAGAAAMEALAVPKNGGPGIVPEILTRTIRDDVIGVLASETAAWFGTLRFAESIRADDARALPVGRFALFMDSPQSCRGRAFTIRGQLRRLVKAPLPPRLATFGIRTVYDAWISSSDSGNQLLHIVALSADPGLPLTENTGATAPAVELTGSYFKREGYSAHGPGGAGELALTPLILAGRIRFVPPQIRVSRASQMIPWLTWIGIAICSAVLIIVWQFQFSDSVFRGTRAHQLTVLPVRLSFEGVESVTIQQLLREMEETAQRSTANASLL